MTLNPLAQNINIKRSLEKYFYEKLKIREGFNIDWEGVKFDDTHVSEWLQPRIVNFAPIFIRQASATEYGEQVDVLFQVNIFVKKTGISTSDRHYRIRDLIVNYFKIGQQISIADHYSDDHTIITYMKVRSIDTDRTLPETQNLYQYVVAFNIDFTRATTKP